MLEIYEELVNIMKSGDRAVLATVIRSQGSAPRRHGAKMLIREDGLFIGTIGGGALEKLVREKASEVIKSKQPAIIQFDLSGSGRDKMAICGGEIDVFLEPIVPRDTLFLFGAGHISHSIASMAQALGFGITVIDPRPEFNNDNRFPGADLWLVEEYNNAFPKLNINENSYIVIVTPSHISDEACLEFAIGAKARYIGMIGSKKKVNELKTRLKDKGLPAQVIDKIHAPIGLAIGAETPAEIAVSILAEIIQVRKQSID